MEPASEVTRILNAIEQGEARTAADLLPAVYQELRHLAASKMSHEAPGQTLQPTSLVHEAWLRVTGGENPKWANRAHFFAAAAEAMRRILIENARRKRSLRHGGGKQKRDVQEMEIAVPAQEEELLAVHEALELFAAQDPRKAELVKLRYFVGLTLEEAAQVMGVSVPMAKRWWTYSRAWLRAEMARP
ncbi:RNA polymerase, sigma-24 subunit, ECF subfamily [Verrucomicrobia bacterium]|nr:RNA polymerase, sigma-24 subunit, ECF subfamily [Verrucomicrobiota bacterium]